MAYTPRPSSEILRELASRVVARGGLDDVTEGSVLAHILASVAEEVANVELRLARIRDSFFLDGTSGADLDDRIADLPPDGLTRLAPSAASGGAMTLRREGTVGALVIPAGTTYGRVDDVTQVYRQIADATILNGFEGVDDVAVVCLSPGRSGNCAAGAINRILSGPAGLLSAINEAALTSGTDEETDEQVASRARAYLASLTGTTPQAIEYQGAIFTASDGSRASFARIYEDPTTPGLAELLLDDGSGLRGYTRRGRPVTGTVQAGGPPVLWHEWPATAPLDPATGTPVTLISGGIRRNLDVTEYTSIPERGLVYLNDGVASAGDTWAIEKYDVYIGLPGELQAQIEGDPSDPLNMPGFRAAGCRLRVVAPTVYMVRLDVNVIPKAGRDFNETADAVREAIVQYTATLGPGEPLFISRLTDRVMDNQDVLAIRVYTFDTGELSGDYATPTPRHVIRTDSTMIRIVPA